MTRLKDNKVLQIFVCLVLAIGFVYLNYYDRKTLMDEQHNFDSVEKEMTDIYAQIVNDEIEKFSIVLKTNDRVAICVQAQMVSAALLQAGKEAEYLKWKKQVEKICDYSYN